MSGTEKLKLEAEHRSKLLIDSISGCALYMLDTEGRVRTWNTGAQRAKGYHSEEILGQHFSIFFTADAISCGEPSLALEKALTDGRYEAEGWRLRKNGSKFWASVLVEPVFEGRGESRTHIGFAKVTRDITRDHVAETRLEDVNHQLDLALKNMSQGMALFDSTETLILANDKYVQLLGIAPELIYPGLSMRDILRIADCENGEADYSHYREARANTQPETILKSNALAGKSVLMSGKPLPDGGWIMLLDDVTEHKKAEARLEHIAHYDSLTEIPNHVLFREFLKKSIQQSKRGPRCALFGIDINRFKAVKNTFGHRIGDELLKAVARRLQNSARDGDMVARMGGDEFALLQTGINGAKDAENLAIRLLEVLRLPFQLDNQEVLIDASIGIAIAPYDGIDADELLRKADLALYRANRGDGPGYSFFEKALDAQFQSARSMEQDLRQALRRDEFELFYQGLVDVRTEKIVGYEALIRWHHPVRGMVSPGEFIPAAEQNGMIVEIGNWSLQTALQQAALWPDNVKVAVNLCAAQLKNESFFAFVRDILAATKVEPGRLEFEITESTLMDGCNAIMSNLWQLQELGVRIALDDFGTGFSSLSYLRNFQFDRLKIDRSFVEDLAHSEPSRVLTRAIAGLGESFGISVTGEGVESRAQFEYLKSMGCSEVQGFYFSKPKPVSAITDEAVAGYEHKCAV